MNERSEPENGNEVAVHQPCSARRFVRMFKPQFAEAVERGEKCQTVRPTPKRMPEAGDTISLRCWTGKPYRSKQRELRQSTITKVLPIEIGKTVRLCGLEMHDPEKFARDDGFEDKAAMLRWFADTHGLPFSGILICWQNAVVCHRPDENQPTTPESNE